MLPHHACPHPLPHCYPPRQAMQPCSRVSLSSLWYPFRVVRGRGPGSPRASNHRGEGGRRGRDARHRSLFDDICIRAGSGGTIEVGGGCALRTQRPPGDGHGPGSLTTADSAEHPTSNGPLNRSAKRAVDSRGLPPCQPCPNAAGSAAPQERRTEAHAPQSPAGWGTVEDSHRMGRTAARRQGGRSK